jgi:hypothetical protein
MFAMKLLLKNCLILFGMIWFITLSNCSYDKDKDCEGKNAIVCLFPFLSNGANGINSSSLANRCSDTNISLNWGMFTGCNDGTVKFEVTAGTYGGNAYTSKTLYFAKCQHGQTNWLLNFFIISFFSSNRIFLCNLINKVVF